MFSSVLLRNCFPIQVVPKYAKINNEKTVRIISNYDHNQNVSLLPQLSNLLIFSVGSKALIIFLCVNLLPK